ncbi:MAG: hypothetical protein BWY68_00501 [bacterium ADurb.Bin400]|nr:MAG: hypothetical protein BWY68_00501 [bacterium ADurb.Bin400]
MTGDRIRFNGHAEVSARQAEAVLERLRVNKKDGTIAKTVWLVENHMKALSFAEMRVSTQKKLARHEQFPNLVALTAADAASSLRPDRTTDSSFVPVMQRIWQEVAREREAGKGPVLLDGHEIARVLKRHMPDFSQREHGRLIGKIKNMVMEAYDEGIVNSKDEALAWLSDNFEELVRKLK